LIARKSRRPAQVDFYAFDPNLFDRIWTRGGAAGQRDARAPTNTTFV
jgi:hypothetical protein